MTVDGKGRTVVESGAGVAMPEAEALFEQLDDLRAAVSEESQEIVQSWRSMIERPAFVASEHNLAAYLALRRRDLRPLQDQLAPLGLSSIGRLEGRVLANLDAVLAALGAIVGVSRPWPAREEFHRGEELLAQAAIEVLGQPASATRPTRIMVTCPSEAATDPAFMQAVVGSGAELVRINCAHDDAAAWQRMIDHLHAAEKAHGRRLKVLMDLGGPKVRTGQVQLPPDTKRLHEGDRVLLVRPGSLGTTARTGFQVECAEPAVLDELHVGAPLLIDDGKIRAIVEDVSGDGVHIRIQRVPEKGAKLKPEKGLNFPGTVLDLPPLGEDDLAALDFVAHHADLVGYSFVQSREDVALLQDELARRRPTDWQRLGIVAKIETPKAVANLPLIIAQAAGRQPLAVMIARGDLAVEIGFVRLAEMQEEIMWLCEAAHIPVIWATQVLESLVRKGLPSRGEMTDAVAGARAECVMLNKGPYLVEAVAALNEILTRMSEHQSKKTARLRALRSWRGEF